MIKKFIKSHIEIIDTENPYFKDIFDYCEREELKNKLEMEKQKSSSTNTSPIKSPDDLENYNPAVRLFRSSIKEKEKKKKLLDSNEKKRYCMFKTEKHELDASSNYKEIVLEEVSQ